jgi:tetratricopeptide (TPR) repeat protein
LERRIEAHAHFAMGIHEDLNGKPDQALAEFVKSAEADPGNEQLVADVARRLMQSKHADKAVALLSQAVKQPQASGLLETMLGAAAIEAGKTDMAVHAFQAATRKAPRSLAAYRNLVRIYLDRKQGREAAKVLLRAARLKGTDAAFLASLAELYASARAQLGRQGNAVKPRILKALDRAPSLKPSAPAVRMKLADGYAAMGSFAKAKALYQALLKEDPALAGLRQKLVRLDIQSGDKEGAQTQLEAISRDHPTDPNVYYLLGSLAAERKDYARAAESFQKTLLLSPDSERVYYDLAAMDITLNKPQAGLDVLERARSRFNKQSFPLEFYSALAYSRLKKYPQALAHFTAAEVIAGAKGQKLDPAFYFQLGAAYERNQEYSPAEKAFTNCLKLSPNDAEAMNYLGYMWTERGVNLQKARDLIEKAVRAEPKNAAFLDSLGWVLFKLNQPRAALVYALRAVEHSAEPDAVLYDHLGDIYAQLKRYDQARQAWRKSLALEPSESVRRKLNQADGNGAPQR